MDSARHRRDSLTLTGNSLPTPSSAIRATTFTGGGNDTLNGAPATMCSTVPSNDMLIGGAGADIFSSPRDQPDIITDLSQPVAARSAGYQWPWHHGRRFAGSVNIAAAGANTLITIGANTIQLNGVGVGTINSSDFMFAH
jgi:hypothetical protein